MVPPPPKNSDLPRPVGGRWFEDLQVGTKVDHQNRRTVTETDNVMFTTMTMNPAWLHLDAEYAAETEFGQIIVNSMYTVALVIGISVHETTLGTTAANLGFEKINFPNPVFIGDTIRVETEVLAARPSKSRPGFGIVTFQHQGFNQHNDLVCSACRAALMHKNPNQTSEK